MILDKKFHGEAPPPSPPDFFCCLPVEWSLRECSYNQWSPPRLPGRYSGPRRRCADRLRGAGGGQDVRGGAGDDTEHEQSGRLSVQQSQEAHIRCVLMLSVTMSLVAGLRKYTPA